MIVIDFLLVSLLTVASRFSFRIMETWARRWSQAGTPTVLIGDVDDLETVLGEMERGRWPDLRPVALADRRAQERQTRFKGYPLYGKGDAPDRAVSETGAGAVVLVRRDPDGSRGEPREGEPGLGDLGGREVEVYNLRVGMSLSKE